MIYRNDLVTNFSKEVSWLKKMLINVGYKFGSLIIESRKNALTPQDKKEAKQKLHKGDIILSGALRRMHSIYIGGVFTHASLYIGDNTCIHAIAHGVSQIPLDDIFEEYDTLAIIRHDDEDKIKIEKTIEYAKKQIGKPFDFGFESDAKKIYCTELIYKALYHSGRPLRIHENKKHIQLSRHNIIHPMHLLKGSLKLVFLSHNVKIEGDSVMIAESSMPKGLKSAFIRMAKNIVKIIKKIRGLPHFEN